VPRIVNCILPDKLRRQAVNSERKGIAACVLPAAILHNLVYGLFILLFGEGFWGEGDEAFFFIIALIVCPILFLIGTIGSFILIRKKK